MPMFAPSACVCGCTCAYIVCSYLPQPRMQCIAYVARVARHCQRMTVKQQDVDGHNMDLS